MSVLRLLSAIVAVACAAVPFMARETYGVFTSTTDAVSIVVSTPASTPTFATQGHSMAVDN